MSGACYAVRGYEFQVDVSIWLALDLIFVREQSSSVLIEPESQEDIEVQVKEGGDPEVSSATVEISSRLTVQVKLRNRPWDEASFSDLLMGSDRPEGTRGPKRRTPPIKALESDADSVYLLVTSGQLPSALKDHAVASAGERSTARAYRGPLNKRVDPAVVAPSRVTVLEQRQPDWIRGEIREILWTSLRVPHHAIDACVGQLRDEAWDRLASSGADSGGRWTRAQITDVVRRHGGAPDKPRELANFVPPTSMQVLRAQVETRYALLLTGPTGVGKTQVAEAILWEHRSASPPFSVITPSNPAELRRHLDRRARVLVYVEDPWGRYRRADHAREWLLELPGLLRGAGPELRFLITSPSGMLDEVATEQRQLDALDPWRQTLEETDYGEGERWRMVTNGLRHANHMYLDVATIERAVIVGPPRLPQALDRFVVDLVAAPDPHRVDVPLLLHTVATTAVRDRVSTEVAEEGDDAVRGAIALWLIWSERPIIVDRDARALHRLIQSHHPPMEVDVRETLRWLVRRRWAQPAEGGYRVHAQVLSGLEAIADRFPERAEDVIVAVLDGLVRDGQIERAGHISFLLRGRRIEVPRQVAVAIDRFLRGQALEGPPEDFERVFFRYTRLTLGDDPVGSLAQALDGGAWDAKGVLHAWQPPRWNEAKMEEVHSSSEARTLVDRFVRYRLPGTMGWYDDDEFLGFIERLGWDLSSAFLDGAEGVLAGHDGMNASLVLKGALAGAEPPFETLLERVLAESDDVDAWWAGVEEQYRAVTQGETDAEEQVHLGEEPQERFGRVTKLLRAIVSSRRRKGNWAWIAEHPRKSDLLRAWAEEFAARPGAETEARALVREAENTHAEGDAWKAVGATRDGALADLCSTRLPSHPFSRLAPVLGALSRLVPARNFAAYIPADLPVPRQAEILVAADEVSQSERAYPLLPLCLPTCTATGAIVACLAVSDSESLAPALQALTASDIEALRLIARGSHPSVAMRAVWVLSRAWVIQREDMVRALTADDGLVRRNAFVAAARLPCTAEFGPMAVNDADARCRVFGVELLADLGTEEGTRLALALADDPSALVREKVAEAIGLKEWVEEVDVLLRLLDDRRNFNRDRAHRDAMPAFQVARQAAKSLTALELRDAAAEQILAFLRGGARHCADIAVHYHLVDALPSRRLADAMPTLQRMLDEPWRMDGQHNAGTPLRYAAAWKLAEYPEEVAALIDLPSIVRLSEHADERIAGPCLVLIGMHAGPALLRQAVSAAPQERGILVGAGALLARREPPALADSPGARLLARIDSAPADWIAFVAGDEEAQRWLAHLAAGEVPFPRAIVRCLRALASEELSACLPEDAGRDDELAQGSFFLTLADIAGWG